MFKEVMEEIDDLYRYRYVIFSFVSSTLKMRYRRSILGFFWSLLGPLLNYCIMGFVFSKIARFEHENYLGYVLFGSLTYNFFNVALSLGGSSLINNENYIKKIYLPKSLFPLSVIIMELINYILGLIAATIVTLLLGKLEFSWALLFLPASVLILTIISASISLLASIAYVYFRDLTHIVPIVMQAVFFATPIVFPAKSVPENYQWLLSFNLVFKLVEVIREPIVYGRIPSMLDILILSVFSLLIFLFSLVVLKRFDNKIVFKL